jgi:hypothetical protein
MFIHFNNKVYNVSTDNNNQIYSIKIRSKNQTILDISKYLALFALVLFAIDFLFDLVENIFNPQPSNPTPEEITEEETFEETSNQQTGGALISSPLFSVLRSIGKYIILILAAGLYIKSFEWVSVTNEELTSLKNNVEFTKLVTSNATPSKPTNTPTEPSTITPSAPSNTTATAPSNTTSTTPSTASSNKTITTPTNTPSTTSTNTTTTQNTSVAGPVPVSSNKVEQFTNYSFL